VVAAAGAADGAEAVATALRAEGVDAEAALDQAERLDVLVRRPGTVAFRHPLLRTAVWSSATPTERRTAHAALAAALPATRRTARAWHRAEAATGPDAALAAELAALADEERVRMGHAAASTALERAALLTDDPTTASSHLAAAIEDAVLAGDVDRSRVLADRALAGDLATEARGRVLASLGRLEHETGSLSRAAQLLTDAAQRLTGRRRVTVLAELALVRYRLGDYAALALVAEKLRRVADGDDVHQRLLRDYFSGVAAMCTGDLDAGRSLLADAIAVYQSQPELRDDPGYLPYATLSVGWLGATPELAGLLEGRVGHARARGALSMLVPVLSLLAYGRAWILGDHRGAFADAGEAVELGTELGFVSDVAPAIEMLAWQHAARGLHDLARAELARADDLVQRAGTSAVAAHLALAHASCALCRGDLDEVVERLEARLAVDEGRGPMGEALGVAPMLVEAYVATGRDDDAADLTARYAAVPSPAPPTRALIARCRALVAADDDAAVAAFEEALAAHAEVFGGDPFERARTQLLYGARLRRSGRRLASRTQLRAARDRFAAMDLTAWAARAAEELAATGETARSRRPTSEEPLTSQETRIALLVGQGMTNREVAAALFVSPKTVEHHLSSVYRKRGLRSRTELARHLVDAAGGL
jgi:DNA-binding CsgD family transcriptional regulator